MLSVSLILLLCGPATWFSVLILSANLLAGPVLDTVTAMTQLTYVRAEHFCQIFRSGSEWGVGVRDCCGS